MYQKILKLQKSGLYMFDIVSVANILNLKKESAAVIIQRLKKRDILLQLQRNKYILKETYLNDIFKVANELLKPSYISLYSALNHFGVSTQSPVDIQSVTTKQGREINNEKIKFNFKYYKIQEKLYFGYQIIENKFIAEKEKALLDIMYFQKKHFDYESIKFNEFDINKLKEYIKKYPKYYQTIFFNTLKYGFGSNIN